MALQMRFLQTLFDLGTEKDTTRVELRSIERAARPPWHALNVAEAVAAVESDGDGGLSADEARGRLVRFGPNALPKPERRSGSPARAVQ